MRQAADGVVPVEGARDVVGVSILASSPRDTVWCQAETCGLAANVPSELCNCAVARALQGFRV